MRKFIKEIDKGVVVMFSMIVLFFVIIAEPNTGSPVLDVLVVLGGLAVAFVLSHVLLKLLHA